MPKYNAYLILRNNTSKEITKDASVANPIAASSVKHVLMKLNIIPHEYIEYNTEVIGLEVIKVEE